jgi:hypothetical protein
MGWEERPELFLQVEGPEELKYAAEAGRASAAT